jgi:serine/threonine-protein kinase
LPLTAGTRIGPYEVTGPLEAGGMGEVYRARDTKLKRDVALKILSDLFAGDAERLARFQREAQVLATLNHPNIGHIYGLEDSGSTCALVLELVEGATLAERFAHAPIPVAEALAIARQIAEALDAAHEQGIIHRDLKPANIRLRDDGTVKVLDFGLAKLAGASGDRHQDAMSSPTVTRGGTELGVILGTAAYMSPEQAKGKAVGKRADIWAFGVVLYEMLGGRQLFGGDSTTEVLAAVVKDSPDWTALPSETPPAVRRLLERCLEKDPRRRLRDIGDARLELESAHITEPVAPARASRRVAPIWSLGAAIVLTAAVSAIVMRSWTAPGSERDATSGPTRRAAIQVTGLDDIGSSSASLVTLSADGSLLVHRTTLASGGSLHTRRLDALESQPIEGTDGAQAAFLSPDGSVVGFQREGEIFSVPVAGGPVTRARGSAHLPEGRPGWMPDGRIVYTAPRGGLVVIRPDGSSPETITEPQPGDRHLSPHPLPDGRTILFTAVGRDITDARIAAVSVSDRRVKTIVRDGAMTPQYADGVLVHGRADGRLVAIPFDPSQVELTGQAMTLPDAVSRTRFGVAQFSAVRGVLVYAPAAKSRLVEIERNGRRETLVSEERAWHHPRYAPDGTRIVFDLTIGGADRDVWVFDRGTKTLSRVTRIGDAHDPSWLPNGREVSFFSFKSGPGPLMIAPSDGALDPQAVRIGGGFTAADLVNPGTWLRDGSAYIGGVKARGAPSDIWRVPRDGTAPATLVASPSDESAPAVSPDGRWLAYQSDETGRIEINVRATGGPDARVQVSNMGGTEPVWDPGGNVLYYVEADGDRRRLVRASLRVSPSLSVVKREILFPDLRLDEADNHPNYDIHPNGDRFVMPELVTSGGLVAVFDWLSILRDRRRSPTESR